jgi:Putative translation initiation inhibitor, yjgF family
MMGYEIHQNRAVTLKYLVPGAVDAYLAQCGDRVACVVGFGSNPVATTKSGCPVLWVDTPVLGSDAAYEIWTANKPVSQYQDELMTGAGNEDIFFGRMSFQNNAAEDLSEVALRAFSGIFEFLQRSNYSNLIRVWNYFPEINAIKNDIERYRGFSIGRHEAFVRYQKKVEDSPAACALGSHGGPLVIYFLAARSPGLQIENPRQISAYSYPKQYGPRSPTFSRATLAFQDTAQTLFISGTASILGHETVHPASVSLQTRETLVNIRAVIEQAVLKGFAPVDFASDLALKVYVRHAEDFAEVVGIIQEELGTLSELIVLQADICRADLLVEIEAVCWSQAR